MAKSVAGTVKIVKDMKLNSNKEKQKVNFK